jgi:hypothetical protein
MKLKMKQIFASQQAMPKLLNRELGDMQASYAIAKNAEVLDVEVDNLNRKRIELVQKYGVFDSAKNQWSIPQDKIGSFNQEFGAVLESEIDIPVTQVSISKIPDAKLSPLDCVSIGFMLTD